MKLGTQTTSTSPVDNSPRWSVNQSSMGVIDRAVSINLVRFLLGTILLVAAALKADSFLTSSASLPWYFTAALVFAELILAGLLFSGAMPVVTWWATVLCFSCFALVAGVKLWRGAVDCGCFGAIATPPWVALTIDLSAVAALIFKYREWHALRRINASSNVTRLPMAIGFALVVVIGMKSIVSLSRVQTTLAEGDPTYWVGQRLPLLDEIDIGAELSSGAWTVILHRSGCTKCDDLLSDAESLSHQPDSRIALVELMAADAGTEIAFSTSGMLLGHLRRSEFHVIPAPLVIQIDDGRVVFAGDQLPSNGRKRADAHSSHSVPTVAFVEKVK
jgi:hypothetical protein